MLRPLPSLCLFLSSLCLPSPAAAFRSVLVGSAFPSVNVKDTAGRDVALAFGSRIVVLVFWRANQEFSTEALKDLEQIKKEFAQRGVEVMAIAEGGTPLSAVQAATKNLGLSFPVYMDAERKLEEKVGVIVFPSTGIAAPGGQLKFYLPSRNSNYRQIIRARLNLELGLIKEKEFDQQMKQIGEELGGERLRAEDHLKTGLRLVRQGKSKDALQELKQALSLDPDLLDAHLALGMVYLDLQDPAAGRREFELVLNHHPVSPGAKLGLGVAAVRLGEIDQGIAILKDAVQINPDPVQGYYELGTAYEKKGELKEAVQAYEWAVRKLLQGRR